MTCITDRDFSSITYKTSLTTSGSTLQGWHVPSDKGSWGFTLKCLQCLRCLQHLRVKFSFFTEQVLSQVAKTHMQPVSLLTKHSVSQEDEGGQSSECIRPSAHRCIRRTVAGIWTLFHTDHHVELPSKTLLAVLGGSFMLEVYWKASSLLNRCSLFLWFCCCGFTKGGQQEAVLGWHFSAVSTWQVTPAVSVAGRQSALQSKGVILENLCGFVFWFILFEL